MTKDQILSYAAYNPLRQSADIALAYQVATPELVAAKAAETEQTSAQSAHLSSRWCKLSGLLPLMGLSLAVVLTVFTSHTLYAAFVATLSLLLAPCLTARMHHYNRRQRYFEAVRRNLIPIAGTDACQEALQYLEAGAPGVVTWRDIALSERGQLYGFDVSVMRRLHRLEQARLSSIVKPADEQVRRLANEEACRRVHGLAPIAS